MEIAGYEGLYYIEPNGDVYSIDRIVEDKNGKSYFREGKLLKPKINQDGYYYLNLYKNGTVKNYLVHRLVALTHLPNHENYPEVNHIDCNRQNNNLNNLEWCSHEYNNQSINTTKNFGCVTKDKRCKNFYLARYTLNKVTHSKHFKTEEEARTWLENEKNKLLN